MIYVNPNIRSSYRDGYVIATFIADTVAELPATNYLAGYTLEMGSTCHVIENSGDYEMQSTGTWVKRIPAELANTYTRAEIDTIESDLQADINTNAGKITFLSNDVLRPLIDSGGKNVCSVNSGSNTLPTRWLQIPISIPAGVYVIKIGNLVSTDTDETTCQFVFFNSSNTAVSNYAYLQRGADSYAVMTVTEQTAYCRLYPSDSYAHSENDTVTATDIMICTKADYEISSTYVPYCPTLAELYALVKSYHP